MVRPESQSALAELMLEVRDMGLDDVEIRPALRGDREAVCRVLTRSIREVAVPHYDNDERLVEFWCSQAMETVDQAISDPSFYVVVAKLAPDEIVGVETLHNEGEVKQCYVTPEARQKGIGEKILGELEYRARQIGLKELRLNSTLGARSFYERNGFKLAGQPFMWNGTIKVHPMSKRL